ncbi:MAG: RHS repeat-associated core domain-containing protein, partial [candidate division Zixibacteria bacterium]|nr:RHS repeat-associated core domain-containing protein [candidate division Zixibacteria bacterium]
GARFYDPSIGRFSSPDPVKDYHNPYSYVRNNPIRYIDPTGMETWGVDFNPELDWGGSIGGSLYGWYDDPFARAVMLADPGTIVTTVDELARWLRMHPGDDSGGQSDPAGSNSSTDMNGTPLDAKEVFRLKTYMTDALQAYSQSGGLVGISPDMYDRAMSFLDAGRVEWADLGGRHGQYIAGDQSEKQSANGFYPGEKIQLNNRDRGLLMSKFGALVASTLVHEVGHSIGQRIYGAGEKYDRCGPGAQARYWASTPWYSGNGPASSDPNVQRRLLYLTAQSRAFFHSPAMWELFLGVTRQGGF